MRGDGIDINAPWWLEAKWLRFTLLIAVVFALITVAVSLMVPKTYRADAKILPTASSSTASSLLSMASASGFGDLLSGELAGAENPTLTYPEILQSRSLLQRVALTPYGTGSLSGGSVMGALLVIGSDRLSIERGVRTLRGVVSVDTNPRSGMITVSAVTRDSVLSAFIVQQMLVELDRFNVESRATRERATREFVEKRMHEAKLGLASAEQTLTIFREANLRIGNSPQLLLEQGRLEREVETRAELYRLLARQYELARIEEKRDTPTFAVVDPPSPPVQKYRPRILVNAVVAFVGAVGLRALAGRIRMSGLRALLIR